MSTAHTHTHSRRAIKCKEKMLQAWPKLVSVEARNEWPLHWLLTSINKQHVQSVNGVLTSPAIVRDEDAKGKVQFQRQGNGACSKTVQGSPGPHSLPLLANVQSSGSFSEFSHINHGTTLRLSWELGVFYFTVYSYPAQTLIKQPLLSLTCCGT